MNQDTRCMFVEERTSMGRRSRTVGHTDYNSPEELVVYDVLKLMILHAWRIFYVRRDWLVR